MAGFFAINRMPLMAHFAKACAMLEGHGEATAEAIGAAVATMYAIRANVGRWGSSKGLSAADRGGTPGHAWYHAEERIAKLYPGAEAVGACGECLYLYKGAIVGTSVNSAAWKPITQRHFDRQREKLDRLRPGGSDWFTALCLERLRQRYPQVGPQRAMTQGSFFKEWKEIRDEWRTSTFWNWA